MTENVKNPSEWVKARRSTNSNACVEMRRLEHVEVRDTKQRGHGPTLQLGQAAYATWLAGAKSGELDHLAGL
ncbi:DUF397 domain-containing protein [Kineosporia sp. NBRC 101731]|uniref:DUF397 domain-containing protein n=1 Tax=Kineosporia sp. NBRC 101731 TaxID=3032199 RepID=UPI0024A49851|nr:DUF397 domain-containing protein [Kineosporia sp. NBRC 101731]GLY28963.1 hypothetical protein Kisp02_23280 [Kineosporia sp. NBRC 101731]